MPISARRLIQARDQLRHEIDSLDEQILSLYGQRIDLARDLGVIKRRLGLPVRDIRVEKRRLARAIQLGEQGRLSPLFIKKLYSAIMGESRRVQYKKERRKP